MGDPIRQHHALAMGEHEHSGHGELRASKSGTGGLNHTSDDSHVPAAGEGHVHETEPSRDAEHHHKEHGHRTMHEDRDHHHGGHKHMHEHHPKDHHGGHKNRSNY